VPGEDYTELDAIEVIFPGDSILATFRGGILQQFSRPLSQLMDRESFDRQEVLEDLASMEDGSRPMLIGDQVWLTSTLTASDIRMVSLRNASRLELDEWLEDYTGGRPGALTDASGRILSMTDAAVQVFGGFSTDSIREILDRVSATAFGTASLKCIQGEQVRDFTALTSMGSQGRRSMLISLQLVGSKGNLLLATFTSPSLAMNAFDADDTRLVRTIFSVIPVPAARINSDGIITEVNRHAARLAVSAGRQDAEGTTFLDWVSSEDRTRVAALHRNRVEGRYAPFRFRAGLTSKGSGENILFEITSILMPDGESTLVFFEPLDHGPGEEGGFLHDQTVRELTDIMGSRDTDGDFVKTLLEFVRVGTGSRGAVFGSRTRRVTVGDAPLSLPDPRPAKGDGEIWSEDSMGINLSIPIEQRGSGAVLTMVGIPSRTQDPLSRLVIQLAKLMAEYTCFLQTVRDSTNLFTSISDFAMILRGRERNVRLVLEKAAGLMGADYMAVHTVSPREPILKPMVTFGGSTSPGALPLEIPSIASWVYTHNETCYVPDTSVDQRFSPVFGTSMSELAVPLVFEGIGKGTLVAGSEARDHFENPAPSLMNAVGMILSLWLFSGDRRSGGEAAATGAERAGHHIGLEDLLRSLSHRMRAPVTTLRSHTDLLLSGRLGDLNDEQKDSLRAMNIAMVDLVEYAERMLTFMKLELQGNVLETAWARPSDVVSSLLPILAEKGGHRSVTVTAQLPADPFTASFDRSMLEQVIGNLVNNAIQFNVKDGMVTISIRQDDPDHWVLEVFNTGGGILPEDLPHVFDRFYTGGNADSPARGLGIGLAIVKSFTEQMGGTISTRSRTGHGTWMTVRFPIS
jgi:signal transduction histidine kinase